MPVKREERKMKFVVFALVALFGSYAFAEEASLNKLKSLKCEFPTSASNDWQKDAPVPIVKKGQKFAFHIDGIDTSKGTARIIGNAGAEDLTAVSTQESIHFLETTPSGNLNITTVFDAHTKEGSYKAVHSRHVTMMGGPLPSQAYGFCRSWQ